MHLLLFAVLFSGWGTNNRAMRVVLEDRAVLEIPYLLCHNLSLLESSGKRIIIEGHSASGGCLFAFSRLRNVHNQNITAAKLDQTGLMELIRHKGIDQPLFKSVGDKAGLDHYPKSVFRIEDPGNPFHDYLMTLEARDDPGGTSFFMLLGPQDEFYKISPSFADMVAGFEIQNVHYDKPITPALVSGSVVLILLNLGFAWFGFYRLAHLRQEGLED